MTAVLSLHAAATLAMTGVIWFVQVVHYPLFRFAADRSFPEFASAHQRRTTGIVLPLMSVELATALLLLGAGSALPRPIVLAGLLLLAAIWLLTVFVQMPLHRRLTCGFDARAWRLLVNSNWLRTAAWSARSVIAMRLLAP